MENFLAGFNLHKKHDALAKGPAASMSKQSSSSSLMNKESSSSSLNLNKPSDSSSMKPQQWAITVSVDEAALQDDNGGPLVGAIDQGTSSSRFVVFTRKGQIAASAQMEHNQIFPAGEDKVRFLGLKERQLKQISRDATRSHPKLSHIFLVCNFRSLLVASFFLWKNRIHAGGK
jgi:hypothetical protein